MATRPGIVGSLLMALDEVGLSRFHFKTMWTAGMGFFTDAYDLFIIGVVTSILTPIWHLTTGDLMWLNSASLISSALGAALFGLLADRYGRKSVYGIESIILVIGALATAFAGNIGQLILFRIFLGLGVGGDYPISAVIMSEFANRPQRGRLVAMVFAMQGLGLLVGPFVAATLLGLGIPATLSWRLMLGFGTLPALSVIYLRRRIPESPRFILAQGEVAAAREVVESFTRAPLREQPSPPATRPAPRSTLVRLAATSAAWFLVDVAFYGNGVSSSLILKTLFPQGTLLTNTLVIMGLFLVSALPGYWAAVFSLDVLGRRRIQQWGFAAMALGYGLLAIFPHLAALPVWFLFLYAWTYFFIEFGPNVTTFIYPAELFPVRRRAFFHGISAAFGKSGAFLGAFLFPYLLQTGGLTLPMWLAAFASVAGLLVTAILPETRQQSLEEVSQDPLLFEP